MDVNVTNRRRGEEVGGIRELRAPRVAYRREDWGEEYTGSLAKKDRSRTRGKFLQGGGADRGKNRPLEFHGASTIYN